MIYRGKCWKFGDNIPTDLITPITIIFQDFSEMAKHVLEGVNPDFPKKVQKGDILVAGKNFACSSGRATAPKALRAAGVGAVVAEQFSRTFYRNAFESGLPILECPGISPLVKEGDELEVNLEEGTVRNLTTGQMVSARPPGEFLLQMLRLGGLVKFAETLE